MAIKKCMNCGCGIGDLETPFVWHNRIVCRVCYAKLQPKTLRKALLIGGAVAVLAIAIGVPIWLGGRNPRSSPVSQTAQSPANTLPANPRVVAGSRPPVAAPVSQPARPADAPKVAISTVRGGAWVTRKSGTSDLLRGLEVCLLNNVLVDPALIRAEYEDKIGKLNAESAAHLKEFNDEKARNDALQKQFGFEQYRERERHYKEWADKLTKLAAARKEAMAKVTAKETLQSAYDHFAKANSYWGTTEFYRVATTAVRQKTHTNSEGKYSFADVPPGRYYIYALMDNSISFIEWLVPVDVADGKEANVDLFNENASTIYNKD